MPSAADLAKSGIRDEPGSPELQVNSLPTELPGKVKNMCQRTHTHTHTHTHTMEYNTIIKRNEIFSFASM